MMDFDYTPQTRELAGQSLLPGVVVAQSWPSFLKLLRTDEVEVAVMSLQPGGELADAYAQVAHQSAAAGNRAIVKFTKPDSPYNYEQRLAARIGLENTSAWEQVTADLTKLAQMMAKDSSGLAPLSGTFYAFAPGVRAVKEDWHYDGFLDAGEVFTVVYTPYGEKGTEIELSDGRLFQAPPYSVVGFSGSRQRHRAPETGREGRVALALFFERI